MSTHVAPRKLYFTVFGALFLLLILTVGVARVDLGPLNTLAAMTIAVAKAALIVLYFMHIRYAGRLTRVFAAAGFLWLAILISLAMGDYLSRQGQKGLPGEPVPVQADVHG
jgi:cytochrome c oxidase subunit 4